MYDEGGVIQCDFWIGRRPDHVGEGDVGHVPGMFVFFVDLVRRVLVANEKGCGDVLARDDRGEGEAEVSSAHDCDADGVGRWRVVAVVGHVEVCGDSDWVGCWVDFMFGLCLYSMLMVVRVQVCAMVACRGDSSCGGTAGCGERIDRERQHCEKEEKQAHSRCSI